MAFASQIYTRHAPSARSSVRLGAGAACVFMLAHSGALPGLVARHISMDWHGRLSLLLAFAVVIWLLVTLLLSPAAQSRLRDSLFNGIGMLTLGALCVASFLWSLFPTATLTSALSFNLVVVGAVLASTLFDWRSLISALALTAIGLGVLSLLLMPIGGVMTEEYVGALRGPWPEKNEAGSVFALGLIAASIAGVQSGQKRWLLGGAVLIAVLILSQSATSLLAGLAGVSIVLALHLFGRGMITLMVGVWLGLTALGLGVLALNASGLNILDLFGRDTSLTGRSEIWAAMWRRIEERPLFGYGYNAWWQGDNPGLPWLYREIDFEVFSAHNAALELMLDFGLIGLGVMALALVVMLVQGLVCAANPAAPQRFVLGYLAAFLIMGLTESVLTGPEGLTLAVFALLSAKSRLFSAPTGLPRQSAPSNRFR